MRIKQKKKEYHGRSDSESPETDVESEKQSDTATRKKEKEKDKDGKNKNAENEADEGKIAKKENQEQVRSQKIGKSKSPSADHGKWEGLSNESNAMMIYPETTKIKRIL